MQLEQQLLIDVLEKHHKKVLRTWQMAARKQWPNRARTDFGVSTPTYGAMRSTLTGISRYLNSQDHASFSSESESSKGRAQLEPVAGALCSLGHSWPDTCTLIDLLNQAIADTLVICGGPIAGTVQCRVALLTLLEIASQIRIQELEHELARSQVKAAATEQLAGRFLSSASHDLRTPLMAITGFSELLIEGEYEELNPDQLVAAGHIFDSSQNLLEIVNNMLDMLRIQAGSLQISYRRVDVNELIKEVVDLLSGLASRRSIGFNARFSPALGTASLDRNIVRHMVYQLLTSCLRSTPSGGVVEIAAEKTDSTLMIITSDTALQLPQQVISSMFGSVNTIENMPVRGYEGWEMGLALVRRYSELHGGRLEVENQEPEGTIFRIVLPLNTPAS